MSPITIFFLNNISVTLVVYGLVFFISGLVFFFRGRKNSKIVIISNLWWLAAFGILQGIAYWIHFLIFIKEPFWSIKILYALKLINLQLSIVSFLCLFGFGINILIFINKKKLLKAIILLVLFVFCILPFIFLEFNIFNSRNWWIYCKVYSSYFICFPAALLSACAVFFQISKFKKHCTVNLINLAIYFLLYGFLTGLFVPRIQYFPASLINQSVFLASIGIPVQFFQTGCVVLITIFILRILNNLDS